MKRCPKCGADKVLSEFHKNKAKSDGLAIHCKACRTVIRKAHYDSVKNGEEFKRGRAEYAANFLKNNKSAQYAKNRQREIGKVVRSFHAERRAVNEFYNNCPIGHQVDHIIPLRHSLVCGLHVIANLQYLTPFDNGSKGNKFDPENFNG